MNLGKCKILIAVSAIFAMVLLTADTANAAPRTASVSGDWNATATWGGSSVPGSADSVTINSGITVTVPSGYAAYCTTITFAANTTATSSIDLADSTASLTASGTVTIPRPAAGGVNQIDVGAGTFSALLTVALSGTTGGTRFTQILISTGTATVSGNITSLGVDSRIVFSDAGTLNAGGTFLSGTAGIFTPSTGTVNYTAAAQTVGTYIYNNLTLSGSGIKTITTASVTVNGILSMEGTATASARPTYGTNATLRYNTPTARTAGAEWLTPFAATGGVIIDNIGIITMSANKVFSVSVPLTIIAGATLNTNAASNRSLSLGGNFVNDGTFTANVSPITISGTAATQSIDGFTTTGTVSMTKTAGTATFAGSVSGAGLTINGNGGTLNLGTGLTHTFTGTWTRTNGTLNGGSSTLKIGGSVSGAVGTFTAGTGTVEWNRAGAQTVAPVIYNNLTLSGSLAKTTTGVTVNGILSMEGTATASAAPTYGAVATLRYNTATARTAGAEWRTPFTATGGVTIENTGRITLNSAEVFSAGVPLTINSGATLATANLQLTLGGDFVNNGGTFTAGSSSIVIANTMVAQSIAGFTTTGAVSMTKTAGTATFAGNVSGGTFTINGIGGILDLGTGLTHTFTGTWTLSAGTLNGGSSTLKIGGNWVNSGTFDCGTGTVELNGSALQAVTTGGSDFNRLTVTNASVAGVSFADSFTTAYFTNTTAKSLMTFAAGRTYTITATGGMNFQGTSGNLVKLRSSTPGSVWLINPSGGSWTANYLDVQDSVNIVQQTILPGGPSTDSGNNTNWFVTDANRDSNNDEIPDWWEYHYYGSLTGLNAGADSDGDGINNLLEYVLGSDPTDAASPTVVYVDDNGGYNGIGTIGNPYKYLDDALNAATDGQMVKLAEGTYQLSNYSLSKKLLIKGTSARKSVIKGPVALGGSGTDGQMLDFTSANFAMSDLTVRLYKDNQPVITYNNNGSGMQVYQNMIFKDNSISAKSIIGPKGAQTSMKVLITNNLFYNNTAGAAVELKANPCNVISNTVTNNTAVAVGFLYSGAGNSNITNNIVRGNTTQISNIGSGTLAVTYCNVEGGYTGTGNITGAPLYMDAANGIFRLIAVPPSPGYNYGTATYDVYDQNNTARATPVLGAYETPLLDYDDDGVSNAQEASAVPPTNPNNPDSDNDGLYDGEEATYGTKPMTPDTDGDLVKDGDEPPIGMNPVVPDGQVLVAIYSESFESQAQYPVAPQSIGGTGPWSGTIWGGNSKYYGDIQVQYVGSYPAAYEGNKIINLKGQIFPRSCNISFIGRDSLSQWWISAAFIFPWKRLPTDYNEACCIGGAFFRLNENGNFCVYDGSTENWKVSGVVIPDGNWTNITVGRNHAAKTCNLWVDSTLVFSDIPITGPDLNDFIRISLSNASEYDVKVDMMAGYRYSPF